MKNYILGIAFVFAALTTAPVYAAHVEVRRDTRGWRLLVDGQPYFVKGVCHPGLCEIGKSPMNHTMRDWMIVDDDHDGRNDPAYQSWVDANGNNRRDKDEKAVGDFQLMKDMGVNTIRLYHHASGDPDVIALHPDLFEFNHPPNKELLRQMHEETGIMVMMGDFLGAYTIGAGISSKEITDYRDPAQCANMLRSVHDMIMEFKDEPYILVWALGNENNLPYPNTNAGQYPVEYAKFVNKVARYIHKLDPDHPVCLVNGETMMIDIYKKYAPDIDIIGFNSYRNFRGFNTLWKEAEAKYGKPVLITEYGTGNPPIDPETKFFYEKSQVKNHKDCWEDIAAHGYGQQSPANALGGFAFDWIDDWWQSGSPETHNISAKDPNFEWHGIMSQGDGRHSPLMRQPRKVYFLYKELWNR